MNGSERRRYPRYAIDGLQGLLQGGHPLHLLRLSQGGMLATSSFEPRLESIVQFELHLPNARVRSAGRVAFVGPDTQDPERRWHRIGLEFTAMGQRSRRALIDYLTAAVAAGRAQITP